MFRSVLRPSSGVSSRTLRNYYVSACLPHRIPVCGGMLSVIYKYLYYSLRNMVIWDVDCYTRRMCGLPVRVYLRCTCQCGVWMCNVVSILWWLCEFIQWVGFIYLLFSDKSVLLAVYLDVEKDRK